MLRYFVSCNEYKNSDNDNLKLLKKNKDDSYRIQSLSDFEYKEEIINNIDKLNAKKDILLMHELQKEELKFYNPLVIKKFEGNNNVKFMSNELYLLNYNYFVNLNDQDIKESNMSLIQVESIKDDLSINIVDEDTYFENRNKLMKQSVIGDLYFYSDDEALINKYENDMSIITEKELDKYEITKHRVFTIDSIPQNIVYDFNSNCMRIFYNICNKSIPISIDEVDLDKYELLNKLDKNKKKAYLIKDFNLNHIIYDTSIIPLLKYLNVYEYENGYYKKINMEEYLKEKDILKYIKKPSSN